MARPVYHGGLIEFIRKILRCVCNHCSKLLLSPDQKKAIEKIKSQTARFHRVIKECDRIPQCQEAFDGCGFIKPKYTKEGLGINIEIMDDRSAIPGADRKQKLFPEEAFRILSNISDEDCRILGLKPEISRPENMIIKNLAVAPPPVRPNVLMSSANRSEDDLTYCYQQILQKNIELQNQINQGATENVLANTRLAL